MPDTQVKIAMDDAVDAIRGLIGVVRQTNVARAVSRTEMGAVRVVYSEAKGTLTLETEGDARPPVVLFRGRFDFNEEEPSS